MRYADLPPASSKRTFVALVSDSLDAKTQPAVPIEWSNRMAMVQRRMYPTSSHNDEVVVSPTICRVCSRDLNGIMSEIDV